MATINPRLRTWSLFGDVKRKPTPYEVVTGKFHYHFRRSPSPFELDPNTALNQWHLEHREGSRLQVADWEGFRDPQKLTYRDYVAMQHDREVFLDAVVDRHESGGFAEGLAAEWVETLRTLWVPLRFPIHVLQMVSLYVGQLAPSSYITNCAHFQAADEMRRIQRIAYWTKVLANTHGARIADTAASRTIWERDRNFQPLRELLEKLLIAYDWGAAFTALDVVVKPVLDTLINDTLGDLATANGDSLVAEFSAEFARDSQRSRAWTAALTRYALEQDPALSAVFDEWIKTWTPLSDAAVESLARKFQTAPKPSDPAAAVQRSRAARDDVRVGTSI
jgi:toluene monooxygenase system protein E